MALTFGLEFRRLRLLVRRTHREIGEQCGISIGGLADIDHDRVPPPPPDTTRRIEMALGDPASSELLNIAYDWHKRQPDRPAGMDIARAVDRDEIDAAATKQWQRANGFSNEQAAIESGFRAGVRWALEREKGQR